MHTHFDRYSRHYRLGLIAPLVARYMRAFHNRSGGTLVPTRAMADRLQRSDFERVHIWPRGVDASLFDPARRSETLRTSWGMKPDQLALIYVGRLAPEVAPRLRGKHKPTYTPHVDTGDHIVAVNSEKFESLTRTETPEGLFGFAYRLRWLADLDAQLTFYPNLEESDRLRSQFDGTMSFDLFSDLDFKVTVYNRYDSAPPEGNEKNDTGVTLALSWEY